MNSHLLDTQKRTVESMRYLIDQYAGYLANYGLDDDTTTILRYMVIELNICKDEILNLFMAYKGAEE